MGDFIILKNPSEQVNNQGIIRNNKIIVKVTHVSRKFVLRYIVDIIGG